MSEQTEEAWWEEYEQTAERMSKNGEYTAADDIRTLVDGLKQHDREKAQLASLTARHAELKEDLRRLGCDAGAALDGDADPSDVLKDVIKLARSAQAKNNAAIEEKR